MIDRRSLVLGVSLLVLPAPALAQGKQSRGSGPRAANKVPAAAARSTAVRASTRAGGHLHKHVARNQNYLKGRVASENARFTFKAAARGADLRPSAQGAVNRSATSPRAQKALADLAKYRARPKRYSTFHNATTTDAMYAQAVRNNRAAISKWLKDPKSKTALPVPFSSQRPVGTTYRTSGVGAPGTFHPAYNGVFVLAKSPSGKFYPKTAKLD